MNIDIIGAPLWEGSGRKGPEKGASCFCNEQVKEIIEKNGHTVKSIELLDEPCEKTDENDTMYHTENVVSLCKNLENAVKNSILKGNFPLTIGGDHALSIGSIAGINHKIDAEDLTVIWVDAHTDINTDKTSDTKHIHGMPLASCLGMGDKRLVDGFGKTKIKLLPQNLYYIGARSVDAPEWEIIKENNINIYGMKSIRELSIEGVCKKILDSVKTKYIHISFDVDFIGSEEYTATGLPIPDGPTIEETKKCFDVLFKSQKVCSADFVEYNPPRDNENKDGYKCCLSILDGWFKNLK